MATGSSSPFRSECRALCRGKRSSFASTGAADPFAVNPIRRSFLLVSTSSLVIACAVLIGGEVATSIMLSVGWLAVTGLVMGLPILFWSLLEEGWRRLDRQRHPSVEELDLPPRLVHVLQRHGYESIEQVEAAPDAALLLLSNMDQRGLRDVRRAVSLWKYRRWQEQGFPTSGYD